MKIYSFIMLALALSCSFSACKKKDEPKAWTSGPIEGYTVTPIPGGATITYNIPRDPDILYVMAEYTRNGKVFTEKSSVYKNTLTIVGFNTTDNVKVTLYKINKQEQRSEPFKLEFVPLKSLVSIAQDSLKMVTGFGGIGASWSNPEATELGVRLMVKNENNELVTKEMYYSSTKNEKHAFRGFENKEYTFAIAFEDKWGNISDTTYFTTTPYFETLVPKPYADYRSSIPYDNTSSYSKSSTHVWGTVYDNIVNTYGHGWLSAPGSSGLSITFDMKQVVKLSRIVIHGYHRNSPYGQVNITQFEAWGIKKIDFTKLKDLPYWLDKTSVRDGAIHGVNPTTVLPDRTFKFDWEYLGWHAITRYDQMVPPDNIGVLNISANGSEYEIPLDAKPVRYVRIFVREDAGVMPPPARNYFSMGEISFYGDNTVPQQ